MWDVILLTLMLMPGTLLMVTVAGLLSYLDRVRARKRRRLARRREVN